MDEKETRLMKDMTWSLARDTFLVLLKPGTFLPCSDGTEGHRRRTHISGQSFERESFLLPYAVFVNKRRNSVADARTRALSVCQN